MKIEDLIKNQKQDGSFGAFHSMSKGNQITTEKALNRFFYLGLDKNNPVVEKTLSYVKKCFDGELEIPDRKEKVLQWDVFEKLMFGAWLVFFNVEHDRVKNLQLIWADIIRESVKDGKFNVDLYKTNYQRSFGKLKSGQRVIDPTSFYMVNFLRNQLDEYTSMAYFEHIMEKGIYYIYNKNLYELPKVFDNKNTIFYLLAIRFAASYARNGEKLNFVKRWLCDNLAQDGFWHMENVKTDGIIFPTSSSWRIKENKLNDINNFIKYQIIDKLP